MDYDVIRQAGRWNGDVMMNAYITNLPWSAIRSLADFPTTPGSYFLKRFVEPPNKLKLLIFPELEDWERELEKNTTLCMATKGHINLLKHLRTVLLQDAALLTEKHPGLYIWKHQLFQGDLFKKFKEEVDNM